MKRDVITGNQVSDSGPYSHGVVAGELIFLSGQTAYNNVAWDGEVMSIAAQTKQCFIHLENVLAQANLTLDHVVKVNVYLTSMSHFEAMNEVYREQFKEPFPARTCVAVLALPLGADVEIECVVRS